MPAAPGVPKWSPILSLPNAAWLQFSNGKWCIHQSNTIDAKLINSKLRFYLKLCNLPTNSNELQVYSRAKVFPSGLKAILRHCTNEMRWLVSISQMGPKYAAVLFCKPKGRLTISFGSLWWSWNFVVFSAFCLVQTCKSYKSSLDKIFGSATTKKISHYYVWHRHPQGFVSKTSTLGCS